jgi:hypothetical protein
MALDVVGYSRLMGEDEAGTARTVGPGEWDRKPRPFLQWQLISYNGSKFENLATKILTIKCLT